MPGSDSIFRDEQNKRASAAFRPSVLGWSLAALALLGLVMGVLLLINL